MVPPYQQPQEYSATCISHFLTNSSPPPPPPLHPHLQSPTSSTISNSHQNPLSKPPNSSISKPPKKPDSVLNSSEPTVSPIQIYTKSSKENPGSFPATPRKGFSQSFNFYPPSRLHTYAKTTHLHHHLLPPFISASHHSPSTMPIFLFLYGTGFAIAHSVFHFGVGFKVHYIFLCLLCTPRMYKYYIHTQDVLAKRLAKLFLATLLLESLFGFCDRVFCNEILGWPVNPQGHALWHVFMGFNSYFANTFLMFCRAQQREWSPKVVYLMGVLPYVKIEKVEEDLRKTVRVIRILSMHIEKLGKRFLVTKEPITQSAAIAQKNSEATRGIAVQYEILVKEEMITMPEFDETNSQPSA